MDLRVLEYFLMVAREENVSHAARLLHISQPTISRQLIQLEDEVGKALFIRGNKSMRLTKEGLLFKNRAEELLQLYHRAVSELSWDQEIRGDVFIGTGETDMFYWLADMIHTFQEQYPQVRFHIISGDSDKTKESVDKGLADMGFLFEPVNIEKYSFRKLDKPERWGVLMLPDHRLADREFIVPEDLMKEKLICPRRMSFQSEIGQWFGRQAEELPIAATYNLITTAIMMTQKQIGVTLCIEKEAYRDLKLKFIPCMPSITVKPIVIWKNQTIFPPAVEAFLRFLSDSKFE